MGTTLYIGGVSCTIAVDGGVKESQPLSGPEATVVFKCAYADRYKLVQRMLPQASWSGGSVIRVIPYAYPPSPNLYAMECTDITGLAPKADSSGWLIYREALVTISFRVPTYQFDTSNPAAGNIDASGQPWTETTVDMGIEVMKVPDGAFKLTDGTPLEESATGLMLPGYTITMRRFYVPIVPFEATEALAGGVNTDPVAFGSYTFPKGCLLFAGFSSSQAIDTTGQVVTSVDYKLLGRGQGLDWNKFRGPGGTWLYANTATDLSGDYPFPYVGLTKEALP